MATAVDLEALRARIRELEGTHARTLRVPTGVGGFDELARGLPVPGLVEIHGAPGSGRTRLALALAVAVQRRHAQPVAWVDLERRLYPPAASALGVDLERLLVVRPPGDRAIWAVEQVARSGCVPLVVVGDARVRAAGRAGPRWAHAAESGNTTVVVISERPSRDLPATVRFGVASGEVVLSRDREGLPGGRASLPSLPPGADPWGGE